SGDCTETSDAPLAGDDNTTLGGSLRMRAFTNRSRRVRPPPIPGLPPAEPPPPAGAPNSPPSEPTSQQPDPSAATMQTAMRSTGQAREKRWAIERKSLSCLRLSAEWYLDASRRATPASKLSRAHARAVRRWSIALATSFPRSRAFASAQGGDP